VDRIKALLSESLAYEPDKNASFRYQKTIDGNPIQLDLLADVARIREDEAILKIHGATTSLDLCCVDGGEDLNDHIETLTINVRDGDNVEIFEITVPNAVGFPENHSRPLSGRLQGRLRHLLLLPVLRRFCVDSGNVGHCSS
jgi:hypothetical protein